MKRNSESPPPKIKTYSADGRESLEKLYEAYNRLETEYGWIKEAMYTQKIPFPDGTEVEVPVYSFRTPKEGPSVWITSGIHGEEPTGPNAIAENIELLGELGKKGIPIVLRPLCNPSGYVRNWRYPDEYRDWQKGHSVGDSEYLLLDEQDPSKSRAGAPSCPEAKALTADILEKAETYPPIFSIDLHEDEALDQSYIYSQGKLGATDPIAKKIVEIMQASRIPIKMEGKTRFDEPITDGLVANVKDGSIDELLSSEKIIVGGEVTAGPAVKTVIVVETPTVDVPLEKRVAAHAAILQSLEELLTIAKSRL